MFPKLTPFEEAQSRALTFFANLTETSAILKLIKQSEEYRATYLDNKLSPTVRAQAMSDVRQINEIFQTMGNVRDNHGINA